jgi:hypothetical protein
MRKKRYILIKSDTLMKRRDDTLERRRSMVISRK